MPTAAMAAAPYPAASAFRSPRTAQTENSSGSAIAIPNAIAAGKSCPEIRSRPPSMIAVNGLT